jgi:MFS family permease
VTVAVAAEPYPARVRRLANESVPALLRRRAFRRYWTAQTVSMFGDQISSVAIPLTAVLVLKADAAEMGYLTALLWLPSLLFGVHAGAWVDRHGRRRAAMIAADLGRFGLLVTLPIACALGSLTLAQLYAVAFGTGILSVLFNVCDATLFVALVPVDRYVDGNTLIYGSRAMSFVGGPSAGGVLVQLLSAPFAIVADALSFVGSALLLRQIRVHEPPPDVEQHGALAAGAKFIARSPIVRPCLCAA